jgi:hypothetical protein
MNLEKPFAGFDGRITSAASQPVAEITTVIDLVNADEALAFLANHPRSRNRKRKQCHFGGS